jgi:hypothetical protein
MAHHCNLVVETLSFLTLVAKIEGLFFLRTPTIANP